MADLVLTGLRRYPVKSCRGEDLTAAEVEPWGVTGDRRWMVIDPDGEVVTAREANRLVLVTPEITDRGLRLSFPQLPTLEVDRPEDGDLVPVEIWDDRLEARLAARDAAEWFTRAMGRPLRLVYLDDPRRRPLPPEYADPGEAVNLADGFPLLLAVEESLARLNSWIAEGPRPEVGRGPVRPEVGPVPMTRFRPNLVVAGAAPFAEDAWLRIRVGEVTFRVVKPCERCVLTTIDPDTAARTKEPLTSLARHRKVGGKTLFAVNLIPDPPFGSLRIGDAVEVLARR